MCLHCNHGTVLSVAVNKTFDKCSSPEFRTPQPVTFSVTSGPLSRGSVSKQAGLNDGLSNVIRSVRRSSAISFFLVIFE